MARKASLEEAADALASRARGARVFLPAGPAEPHMLYEALQKADLGEVTFTAIPLPGLNAIDWAGLHESCRFESYLMTPEQRGPRARGQLLLKPLPYREAHRAIAATDFAVSVAHVSAQNAAGRVSFGLAADMTVAGLAAGRFKIGMINRQMPAIADGPWTARDAFDLVVEGDWPLPEAPALAESGGAEAIAERVFQLVPDGATVQVGVGKLPSAVLKRLAAKRNLKVHSGLLAEAHLALLDAGAIADEPAALLGGVALGTATLYQRLAAEPRAALRGVDYTHDFAVLSAIPKLHAINAALEVDLFGQVNAEFAGLDQIASVGGLSDFTRGARASPGGRAIVMLQAEGKGGQSRIVARLSAPAVTLTRNEAPTIVTEFGVADLAGLDTEARAQALTALAPPAARGALSEAWAAMGRT